MKDVSFKVYCWTNSITGKSYIGFTGDGIEFRWSKHLLRARAGGNSYFDRAIRKYGPDAWTCKCLYECSEQKEAQAQEIKLIAMFNTLAPNGYNSAKGGTGGNTWFGINVSERRNRSSKIQSGSGNANFSGMSDDEILDKAEECWLKNQNWVLSEWQKRCKLEGIPQHIVSWRFSNFGGGFVGMKAALLKRLQEKGIPVAEIKYKRTKEHNKNMSTVLTGRIWVTDIKSGKSFLASPNQLSENIIKGRNVNNRRNR